MLDVIGARATAVADRVGPLAVNIPMQDSHILCVNLMYGVCFLIYYTTITLAVASSQLR
jgi:hypothetical protein